MHIRLRQVEWHRRAFARRLAQKYVSSHALDSNQRSYGGLASISDFNSLGASRNTRSGAQFSPYELATVDINGRAYGVIRIGAALAPSLREALAAADARAACLERTQNGAQEPGDDEWEDEEEDEVELASRPPSPLSSTYSSPLSSPPASPLSSPPASPAPTRPPSPAATPSLPPPQAKTGVHAQRSREKAAERRRGRRQRAAATGPYERELHPRSRQTYREQPAHRVSMDASSLPAAKGAWIGRRSKPTRRVVALPELDEMECQLIEWNGRDPKVIVDSEWRIVAILLGRPDDPEWDNVVKQAAAALARARRNAIRRGLWFAGGAHCRGRYMPVTGGVSFGGGQRRPGNLRLSRGMRRILLKLLENPYIRRIAGFQSAGLALYAPKLYRYYRDILRCLFRRHPDLVHTFTNSIFPAVTFNCGPDAFTFDHCDFLNLPHGLCPVTSAGNYDHKRGGHMYMKQLHLVIEFPSGASMAIPSGCVHHGNTPIQPGETRHSITQYAAGGLFRWAAYGYQSAKELSATEEGRARKAAVDGEPGARWEWALGLFSKLDELERDRTEVFGARTASKVPTA